MRSPYQAFFACFGRLNGVFGKNVNEAQADFWFQELEEFDADLVSKVLRSLGRSEARFPAVAAVIRMCQAEARAAAGCETCSGTGIVILRGSDAFITAQNQGRKVYRGSERHGKQIVPGVGWMDGDGKEKLVADCRCRVDSKLRNTAAPSVAETIPSAEERSNQTSGIDAWITKPLIESKR